MGKAEDWMRRRNRLGFKPPTDMEAVKRAIVGVLIDQGPKKTFDLIHYFRGTYGEGAVKQALTYLSDDGYISRPNREHPWTMGKPKLSGIITSNEIRGVISNLSV